MGQYSLARCRQWQKLWLSLSLAKNLDGPDASSRSAEAEGVFWRHGKWVDSPPENGQLQLESSMIYRCKSVKCTLEVSDDSVVLNRKIIQFCWNESEFLCFLEWKKVKQIHGGGAGGVPLLENTEKQCFLFKHHKVRSWSSLESEVLATFSC